MNTTTEINEEERIEKTMQRQINKLKKNIPGIKIERCKIDGFRAILGDCFISPLCKGESTMFLDSFSNDKERGYNLMNDYHTGSFFDNVTRFIAEFKMNPLRYQVK